jgi:hypothetical protein
MAAATGPVVDLIMHVLQTAELARPRVGIPPVVAEGVEVGVRQQQEADVAAQRGQFVGKDGGDARVLGLAPAVRVSDSGLVAAPLVTMLALGKWIGGRRQRRHTC